MDDLCDLAVSEKAWLQVKMTLLELLPSFLGNFRASSARSCSIDVQLKSVEPQVSYCYWQYLAYHHSNCDNLSVRGVCVCVFGVHLTFAASVSFKVFFKAEFWHWLTNSWQVVIIEDWLQQMWFILNETVIDLFWQALNPTKCWRSS